MKIKIDANCFMIVKEKRKQLSAFVGERKLSSSNSLTQHGGEINVKFNFHHLQLKVFPLFCSLTLE